MESKTSAENAEKEKDKKEPTQKIAQTNTTDQNNPQNNPQNEETKSKLNSVLDTFFKPNDKKLSINLFLEKSKSDGRLYKQSKNKKSEKTDKQNEEKLEDSKKALTDEEKGKQENAVRKIENKSNSKTIKLKTNDNIIFEVPIDILHKVKFLSEILDFASDDEVILLKEVDAKNFERIIDYLIHYKDTEPKEIPKPFPERTDDEFLRSILNDDWTFDFLQSLSLEEAINLVNASNYLQIEGLINLLAAKLAHEMCNCEIEEARRKFGIECDMTEEEVAEYDKYPLD